MNEDKRYTLSVVLQVLLKAGCYLLLFVGSQTVVSVAVILVMTVLAAYNGTFSYELLMEQVTAQSALITLLSGLLTLAVGAVFFAVRRKKLFREAGLVRADAACVGAAAAVTPLLYLAVSQIITLLPKSMTDGYAEASAGLNEVSLLMFLSTVVTAPLVEEVVFRGLILSRLERGMPAAAAVVIAALLFGLCHGQIIWVIYAALLGLIFGRMRMVTGSILPCLVSHLLFNLIGFLVTALSSLLPNTALVTGLLIAAAVGLLAGWKKIPVLLGLGRDRAG